ncbi:hypothetical protein HUJ04_006972 [Dendroctonus ponderosae]|nr:hypothetical protein HUJ04_006972 [Dendroctonus ponderosae]
MAYHKNTDDNKRSPQTTYYYCSRNGKRDILPYDQRKRALKSQGCKQFRFFCTSVIILKSNNDEFKVTYYKSHYGHDIKLAHMPLPLEAKNMIATQLIHGVPPSQILNKIRESVDAYFQRLHLTTKLDIHNILRSYNLYDSAVQSNNDALSVEIWIEQQTNKNNNVVLLYKKQGEVHPEFKQLHQDDFVLGFMTKYQV